MKKPPAGSGSGPGSGSSDPVPGGQLSNYSLRNFKGSQKGQQGHVSSGFIYAVYL